MSYLDFALIGNSRSGLTKVWEVKSSTHLGIVSWYGPWRKYTFHNTYADCIFDANCLREIADFCETQTKEHKLKE
jgi:hypothetical protein